MSAQIEDAGPDKYAGADWLKSCGRELSPFGVEVADILGQVYRGIYHVNGEVLHERCKWANDNRIEVVINDSMSGGLSTYDFNNLTALVILCHDRCVRLTIEAASYKYLRLLFHKREGRGGLVYDRHPTLTEAVQ